MDDLIITKPTGPGQVNALEFSQTKEQHDPEPCLRLYCWSRPDGFILQIRGTAPLGESYKKDLKPRNLIATLRVDREDLKELAAGIARILAEAGDDA